MASQLTLASKGYPAGRPNKGLPVQSVSESANKVRTLSRTEKRLLRRILKKTTDAHPVWAELNIHVAKCLSVDRSTIVRAIKKLINFDILSPLETRGGRGVPSSYWVDRARAQKLLRMGYWSFPSSESGGQKLEEETKPATQEPLSNDEGTPHSPVNVTCQVPGQMPAIQPEGFIAEDWNELFQDLLSEASRLIFDVVEQIRQAFGDLSVRQALGLLGLVAFDVWAVYTVWKHRGIPAALLTSVPAGAATYAYWRLTETEAALRKGQKHPCAPDST